MVVCAGRLGEASWKVFRRRTEQRSCLQGDLFHRSRALSTAPKQVESTLKSAAELVKVTGGNWATSFWQCNPSPKHSHTTTLFQSSLSRNTSCGAALRAGCFNQLIFFSAAPPPPPQSLTRNQTSLPMLSPGRFTWCSQMVWSPAISGGWSPPRHGSGLLVCLQPHKPLTCSVCSSSSATAIRESANQSHELYGLSRESASGTRVLTQLELKSAFISLTVSYGVNHHLPRKHGAWDGGFPSNKP